MARTSVSTGTPLGRQTVLLIGVSALVALLMLTDAATGSAHQPALGAHACSKVDNSAAPDTVSADACLAEVSPDFMVPPEHRAPSMPPLPRATLSGASAAPGTIYAWGRNTEAEHGTDTQDSLPSFVSCCAGGTLSAAAGEYHAVASDLSNAGPFGRGGSVWTWGRGWEGELGDGNLTERENAATIPSLFPTCAVGAGGFHSLAVKCDGSLWAWGANWSGQLGDGTRTNRTAPVHILTSIPGGITSVVGGEQHTLVLFVDGTMAAWGANWAGQLGDGTTISRDTPVSVVGLNGIHIMAIAASGHHNLALSAGGNVYAWGWNDHGELGVETGSCNGVNACSSRPVLVANIGGKGVRATEIATGFYHSMAVLADGTGWTWGANWFGQLGAFPGSAQFAEIATPVQFGGADFTGVTQMMGGATHTLALRNTTLYAAGQDAFGELGDGRSVASGSSGPVRVQSFLHGLSDGAGQFLPAQGELSLFNFGNSNLYSWGSNVAGQLGQVSLGRPPAFLTQATMPNSLPEGGAIAAAGLVPGGTSAVSAGLFHTLSLQSDGSVWAWGGNWLGQRGDGTLVTRQHPAVVNGLSGIASVAAGWYHSLAVGSNGSLWAWGDNSTGELGNGSAGTQGGACACVSQPALVNGVQHTVAAAGGAGFSLAVESDGTVWGWGSNSADQLGQAGGIGACLCMPIPTLIPGLTTMKSVAGGQDDALALRSDGTVWAWGSGDADRQPNRPLAGRVPGINNATAIADGAGYAMALESDGTVWAWGDNASGQLGDGSTTDRLSPVQVSGLSGITAIAAGGQFAVAIKGDGTVWAWGNNVEGQLGDGTAATRLIPVQSQTTAPLARIAAGRAHVAAVTADWHSR
jgi:alpha-tubulin suppressor-like RCC1 family protein